MFDATFESRIRDPEARWGILDGLALLYGQDRRPVPSKDVDEAASRFRIEVPDALRRWCETFGDTSGVTSGQNHFLGPERWELRDDVLVVYRENQGCADWGIHRRDLGLRDPPVMMGNGEDWIRQSDTFSMFTLSVALTEAVFGFRGHVRGGRFNDGVASNRLRTALHHLGVPVLRFAGTPEDEFLGEGDLLVYVVVDFFFATATNPASLERIGQAAGSDGVTWT